MKKHLLTMIIISSLFACSNNNDKPNIEKSTTHVSHQSDDSLLFSENDLYNYLKFDKQIILDGLSFFTPECHYYDGSYYFYDFNKQGIMEIKKGDKIGLIKYENGKTSELLFTANDNMRANNVVVTDKYYIFLCYQKVVIFDKSCDFVATINSDISWDYGSWQNGKVHLFNKLYGIASSVTKEPTTATINFSSMSIDNIHKFRIPKGSALSYRQPKVIFGLTGKGYFLSDITEYKIEFYDFNFNLSEVIKYRHNNWRKNDSICDIIDSYNDFNVFRSNFNSYNQISYIEKILPINDSTLFVSWIKYDTTDNSEIMCTDIWRHHSGKWNLYKNELYSYFNSNKISNNTISYDFIPFFYNTITLHNNLVTRTDHPFNLKNYIGQKFSAYFFDEEKYYEEGTRKTSLLFFKFKE